MHRIYDIMIADDGAYLVVNLPPARGGPTDREEAIAFAIAEAARIGWTKVSISRVAKTPLGGYSVSIHRA